MDDNAKPQHSIIYRERVVPSFTSFLPTILFVPALALTFAPFSWVYGLLAGIVLCLSAIAFMVALSPVVEISDSSLRVGKAVIERKYLANPREIARAERFSATRTELNALAFVALQASVKGLVRVELQDPKDPSPYWLFSSRRPEEVVKLLARR